MTLKDIWRSFQSRMSFQQSLAGFHVARSLSNSWASCLFFCMIDDSKQLALQSHVRSVNVSAVKGSVVRLNCTLDAQCFNHSVRWTRYAKSDQVVIWYSGLTVHPSLRSNNVTVDDDPVQGWSMLIIPRARLADSGRFHCHVTGVERCEMNFHLQVAGK